KIILTKDSSIDATQNAINVNLVQSSRNSHNKNLSIDSINIQEGAKVSGGQAGIKIGQSQEVKNSNGTGKDNTVGQIIVAGEVKGGSEGGIVNEGTIKADANGKSRSRRSLDESQQSDEESKAAILIKESGQITDFTNTGLIAGTTNKRIFGSQNVSSIQIGKDQESLQRSSTTTTIKNFKNQGLIGNSNQDANAIGFDSANLTTFINTQLILSQGKAIHLESTHITN
ncbi:hypothetical protein, partial [Campylobacter hepaticus]|uniref:hypothetical protein n=1 Tax=Campylobacter hepaticus TaxID=1813019 RepID=UPI00156224A4